MIGVLYINGKDAYLEWGITFTDTSMSSLLTPPSMKDFIENESRMENGKRVIIKYPKLASRDVTLEFNMTAKSKDAFFANYISFCEELSTGVLEIETIHQPGIVYHMSYLACNQFSEFMYGIAKFTLKLNEPNPADRSKEEQDG